MNNFNCLNNTISAIDFNIRKKQPCCIGGCSNNSFSRFVFKGNLYQNPKYVCLQCASVITDFSLCQLSIAEQYVMLVKDHFNNIKNKITYRHIINHSNKNVTGNIRYSIGNISILITEFNNKNYGLIIDGKPYQRNLYNHFANFKQVYDFTVNVINNKYSNMITEYLYGGNSFVMP